MLEFSAKISVLKFKNLSVIFCGKKNINSNCAISNISQGVHNFRLYAMSGYFANISKLIQQWLWVVYSFSCPLVGSTGRVENSYATTRPRSINTEFTIIENKL